MSATADAAAETCMGGRLGTRRGWSKPDIKNVVRRGTALILKDFAEKAWIVRRFGRWQVRREIRALGRLQGLRGIPACHGWVSPCGILIERVQGERITRWHLRAPAEIARMLARLEKLVNDLHARGIVHLDLRKRDNILITDSGMPLIIDFNASICFEAGSLAARLVLPLLRRIDTSAVLKWKSRLAPELLTAAEKRRHRIMSVARRLWIFS
jgi:RIO-like serine/threonine protein kinase